MGHTEAVDQVASGTSTAAELSTTPNNPFGLVNSDFVQIREDAEYWHIDIGRSEESRAVYGSLYKRLEELEQRYESTLDSILAELDSDNDEM